MNNGKDTHYFLSWKSYNDNNVQIAYGSLIINLNDEEIDSLEKDVIKYCLNKASVANKDVVGIHLVAFNRV